MVCWIDRTEISSVTDGCRRRCLRPSIDSRGTAASRPWAGQKGPRGALRGCSRPGSARSWLRGRQAVTGDGRIEHVLHPPTRAGEEEAVDHLRRPGTFRPIDHVHRGSPLLTWLSWHFRRGRPAPAVPGWRARRRVGREHLLDARDLPGHRSGDDGLGQTPPGDGRHGPPPVARDVGASARDDLACVRLAEARTCAICRYG